MTATLPILEALSDIVTSVQANHSGIPDVVIVLGASAPKKHGHFHAETWAPKEGEGKAHEVLLSGESLERGAVATFGTLVHELAHAYCYHNGIKDTSNRGRYHNLQFRAVAERFGLTIEQAPRIGFSVTSVPASTQAEYHDEITQLKQVLTHYRCTDDIAETTSSRKKYRAGCGCIEEPVPVSKNFLLMSLTCDFCHEPFRVVSVDE